MMKQAKRQGLGRRSPRLDKSEQPRIAKKPPTKTVLIEVSEKLFGQYGLDGISLREIAAAAGLGSNNIVQYHFNDKEGLIAAILESRVAQMAAFREELAQGLDAAHPQYKRELLKTLWLPRMQIRDSDGAYVFCRFLLQLLMQPNLTEHPLAKYYSSGSYSDTGSQIELQQVMKTIKALKAQFPDLPQPVFSRRLSALNFMHLATVVEHDNRRLTNKKKRPDEYNLEFILDMAVGALAAPY